MVFCYNTIVMKIKQKIRQKNDNQARQDAIFRKMSADKRMETGSQLWRLAKDLVGDKINYAKIRPSASFGKCR